LPISICNETRTPFYFRAYDAACNALAEALADLLTRDRRLAASAGHRARVAVV
jgi:predicted nucleic acid-binding protein